MIFYSNQYNMLMIWDMKKNTIQIGKDIYIEAPAGLVASLITNFEAKYVGAVE